MSSKDIAGSRETARKSGSAGGDASTALAKAGSTSLAESAGTTESRGPRIVFGDAWNYAPAPEATDHVRIQPRYELFIG